MDKEEERQRREARSREYMQSEFLPGANNQNVGAEHRVANALEYIAYQLGDISRSLKKLADKQE